MSGRKASTSVIGLLCQASCRSAFRPSTTALRKQLHSSPSQPATPLPHPVAPGPPPKPPEPAASLEDERVARKRRQAELLERGRKLRTNPAKPSSTLQKRFWKDVSVKETPDGYQVLLDTRPVRTPAKHVITIPLNKPHLATAIALEWDLLVSANQALKNHYIPLTSLISRALDIDASDKAGDARTRDSIVQMLMNYLTTDTLLCWAPTKNIYDMDRDRFQQGALNPSGNSKFATLREQQEATARPIINFLTANVWPGVEIKPAMSEDSIMPESQPEMTGHVIRGWISGLSAWDLAGLERACLASKSICIAARFLVEWSGNLATGTTDTGEKDAGGVASGGEARFGIESAAEACSLEVRWQTGMWGEVEDTHDVEKEDLRMQLGSVVMLVHGEST